MATRIVRPHSSRRIPTTTSDKRQRMLGTADQIYEHIGGMAGGECFDLGQCRLLHFYLTEFLALPDDVLRQWEKGWTGANQ